jgi:hypothetical protein
VPLVSRPAGAFAPLISSLPADGGFVRHERGGKHPPANQRPLPTRSHCVGELPVPSPEWTTAASYRTWLLQRKSTPSTPARGGHCCWLGTPPPHAVPARGDGRPARAHPDATYRPVSGYRFIPSSASLPHWPTRPHCSSEPFLRRSGLKSPAFDERCEMIVRFTALRLCRFRISSALPPPSVRGA